MSVNLKRRWTWPSIAIFALTGPVSAQEPTASNYPYDVINAATAQSNVTAIPIRGGVKLIDGAGGNIVALHGPAGTLLVDSGISVARDRIANALGGFAAQPLKYVINTHWHWDHTDGNGWAKDEGATILAHPNTTRHLGETIRVAEWGHTFEPLPPKARPTRQVGARQILRFGGESIEVSPYVASHTDGDLRVYFRHADVLVTGDTFWNGYYPFIDYVAGGSINGMIAASNDNLAKLTPNTLIVPGHGPIARRADLVAFRDMLVQIRDRVAAMKARGMTLEQAVASKPTKDFDGAWGKGVITPALMTELAYRGAGI